VAEIESKKLPGEHVRERDQLRSQQRIGRFGEEWAERALYPPVVGSPAAIRDYTELGNLLLLRQQPQGGRTPSLVVIEQVLDGTVYIPNGCGIALSEDLGSRLLSGGRDESVPRAEVSEDGLDCDAGALGDVLERDLVVKPLDVEIEDRAHDPATRPRRALCARAHPVRTGSRDCCRFHDSRY
jgi:hypothetical protein